MKTTPTLLAKLTRVEQARVYCQHVLIPAHERGMDTSTAPAWSLVLHRMGEADALEYLASEVNNRLRVSHLQEQVTRFVVVAAILLVLVFTV